MVKVTGTLIWYYFVCKREVWFMAREINPFEEFDLLEIGRLIHEESYSRSKKEINLQNIKIDVLTKQNGKILIGEMKKSSNFLLPAKMQLLFYLYKLKKMGIEASGELLVPKERKRERVELTEEAKAEIKNAIEDINKIISLPMPPEFRKSKFCKKCAYRDLCFS